METSNKHAVEAAMTDAISASKEAAAAAPWGDARAWEAMRVRSQQKDMAQGSILAQASCAQQGSRPGGRPALTALVVDDDCCSETSSLPATPTRRRQMSLSPKFKAAIVNFNTKVKSLVRLNKGKHSEHIRTSEQQQAALADTPVVSRAHSSQFADHILEASRTDDGAKHDSSTRDLLLADTGCSNNDWQIAAALHSEKQPSQSSIDNNIPSVSSSKGQQLALCAEDSKSPVTELAVVSEPAVWLLSNSGAPEGCSPLLPSMVGTPVPSAGGMKSTDADCAVSNGCSQTSSVDSVEGCPLKLSRVVKTSHSAELHCINRTSVSEAALSSLCGEEQAAEDEWSPEAGSSSWIAPSGSHAGASVKAPSPSGIGIIFSRKLSAANPGSDSGGSGMSNVRASIAVGAAVEQVVPSAAMTSDEAPADDAAQPTLMLDREDRPAGVADRSSALPHDDKPATSVALEAVTAHAQAGADPGPETVEGPGLPTAATAQQPICPSHGSAEVAGLDGADQQLVLTGLAGEDPSGTDDGALVQAAAASLISCSQQPNGEGLLMSGAVAAEQVTEEGRDEAAVQPAAAPAVKVQGGQGGRVSRIPRMAAAEGRRQSKAEQKPTAGQGRAGQGYASQQRIRPAWVRVKHAAAAVQPSGRAVKGATKSRNIVKNLAASAETDCGNAASAVPALERRASLIPSLGGCKPSDDFTALQQVRKGPGETAKLEGSEAAAQAVDASAGSQGDTRSSSTQAAAPGAKAEADEHCMSSSVQPADDDDDDEQSDGRAERSRGSCCQQRGTFGDGDDAAEGVQLQECEAGTAGLATAAELLLSEEQALLIQALDVNAAEPAAEHNQQPLNGQWVMAAPPAAPPTEPKADVPDPDANRFQPAGSSSSNDVGDLAGMQGAAISDADQAAAAAAALAAACTAGPSNLEEPEQRAAHQDASDPHLAVDPAGPEGPADPAPLEGPAGPASPVQPAVECPAACARDPAGDWLSWARTDVAAVHSKVLATAMKIRQAPAGVHAGLVLLLLMMMMMMLALTCIGLHPAGRSPGSQGQDDMLARAISSNVSAVVTDSSASTLLGGQAQWRDQNPLQPGAKGAKPFWWGGAASIARGAVAPAATAGADTLQGHAIGGQAAAIVHGDAPANKTKAVGAAPKGRLQHGAAPAVKGNLGSSAEAAAPAPGLATATRPVRQSAAIPAAAGKTTKETATARAGAAMGNQVNVLAAIKPLSDKKTKAVTTATPQSKGHQTRMSLFGPTLITQKTVLKAQQPAASAAPVAAVITQRAPATQASAAAGAIRRALQGVGLTSATKSPPAVGAAAAGGRGITVMQTSSDSASARPQQAADAARGVQSQGAWFGWLASKQRKTATLVEVTSLSDQHIVAVARVTTGTVDLTAAKLPSPRVALAVESDMALSAAAGPPTGQPRSSAARHNTVSWTRQGSQVPEGKLVSNTSKAGNPPTEPGVAADHHNPDTLTSKRSTQQKAQLKEPHSGTSSAHSGGANSSLDAWRSLVVLIAAGAAGAALQNEIRTYLTTAAEA